MMGTIKSRRRRRRNSEKTAPQAPQAPQKSHAWPQVTNNAGPVPPGDVIGMCKGYSKESGSSEHEQSRPDKLKPNHIGDERRRWAPPQDRRAATENRWPSTGVHPGGGSSCPPPRLPPLQQGAL
eukprot:gene9742-biopygen192